MIGASARAHSVWARIRCRAAWATTVWDRRGSVSGAAAVTDGPGALAAVVAYPARHEEEASATVHHFSAAAGTLAPIAGVHATARTGAAGRGAAAGAGAVAGGATARSGATARTGAAG